MRFKMFHFFMLAILCCSCLPSKDRAKVLKEIPAWRGMKIEGISGSYLKFACDDDSLYLLMGNKRQAHFFHYGPCEIDLLDIPHLEFVTPEYAGISHFMENHDWNAEVFRIDQDSLSKEVFTKPLAYAPDRNLISIPDTGSVSQILILNYENQTSQSIPVDSCIFQGDPLPCIMDVVFREDSLIIWRESKRGLEMDSIKVLVKI